MSFIIIEDNVDKFDFRLTIGFFLPFCLDIDEPVSFIVTIGVLPVDTLVNISARCVVTP